MNWFLWPGDRICDLLKLRDSDDRQAFRTFANLIVWGIAVVAASLVVGRLTAQ
jgi:hypothetical protein